MMDEVEVIAEKKSKWPKSELSIFPSLVRFINRTERNVEVLWINYKAVPYYYNTLAPNEFLDVNTYVGHPWIFKDAETGDHMVVQRKIMYLPKRLPSTPVRRCVTITLPIFPLKTRCLQVFKKILDNPDKIKQLEIPLSLKQELEEYYAMK